MDELVLLALSSFRHSDQEVEHALRVCLERGARLVALFVVDLNLARYFAGSGVMVGTSLREQLEQGILDEHRRQAEGILAQVREQATARNVACSIVLRVGRFAEEVKAVLAAEPASVVVVTRARRPQWLRVLFGSPVDRLRDELSGQCRVDVV